MFSLEFSAEQVEILSQVLRHHFVELTFELSHTDTREYKEMLKRRKELLQDRLEKLSHAPAAV